MTKRPVESDYNSHVAYTRALDAYCDSLEQPQESKCNPHPKAPHGFDRNASHSAHRYVCECESWDPYQSGYDEGFQAGMKAEQELEQPVQEPVAWMEDEAWAPNLRPLYTAPQAQQPQLLTDEIESLRKDAGRYRWWRDNACRIPAKVAVMLGPLIYPEQLDAANDAEMEANIP